MAKLGSNPLMKSIKRLVTQVSMNDVVNAITRYANVFLEHDHTGNNGSDKGVQLSGDALQGPIPDSKLATITTVNKVKGRAIDWSTHKIIRADIGTSLLTSGNNVFVPSGTIIIWTIGSSCPAGYGLVFEDKFVREGSSDGVSDTHSHDVAGTHTHTLAHEHTLAAHNHTISSAISGYHLSRYNQKDWHDHYKLNDNHTHVGTLATQGAFPTTGGAGGTSLHPTSAQSSDSSVLDIPEYKTVMFCGKL